MKQLFFLFFFISFTSFGTKSGPEDSYYVVHDLTMDWHVYNEDKKQFVPYLTSESVSEPAHTVFLNAKKYKNFTLLVKPASPKSFLFINGILFREIIGEEWYVVPVSELPIGNEDLTLTLYGSFSVSQKLIFIGERVNESRERQPILKAQRDNIIRMKQRIEKPYANSFVLLFGILLLFTTYLSSVNSKAFGEYFSLEDLLVTKIRDTKFLISKPLSQVNLTFVGLLSFASAILYILMAGQGIYLFDNPFELHHLSSTRSFLYVFLLVSAASFSLSILKFFMLNLMSRLFGIKKSINIHHFKVIQFMLLFFMFAALAFYAVTLSPNNLTTDYTYQLFWIAVVAYSLRTILIYFSILKSTGIQSLYLFAYLCVVEILPIIIGIRFAF